MPKIKENISLLTEDYIKETKFSNEVDLIVKDTYPDVESIIDYSLIVEDQNIRFDGNKYNVSGKICCDIIYVADDEEKSICSINYVQTFEEIVDLKGITVLDEKELTLSLDLDYMNVTLLNSRKLNIKYVLDCKIQIVKNEDYEVILDIDDEEDICKKCKTLSLYEVSEKIKEKFLFKERYQLPSSKPEIQDILRTNINIIDVDFLENDSDVVMNANLNIGLLYKSLEDEIIQTNIILPIKECIEDIENFNRDFDYKINIIEKNITISNNNEDERRVIDVEIMFELCMNIYDTYEKNILEDIYSSNKEIDLKTEKINTIKQICKNDSNYNLREIVKIDLNDVMQVVDTTAKIKITDVEILNGVSKVYGDIEGKSLCIVANDKSPLQVIKFSIPITQVIETKGSEANIDNDSDESNINNSNDYKLTYEIESILTNMLNPEELEMRFNVNINIRIYKKVCENVISDIEIGNEKSNENTNKSMRIHIAQNDELLWNVLKKYSTKIENVRMLNRDDLTQETVIKKNEKILIM